MTEALAYFATFAGGALLGLIFFGGLWTTINGLTRSHNPALRMLTSLLVRFALVLAVFYLLARYGGWQHLLVSGAGFTLPRLIMVRYMRDAAIKKESTT